MAGGSKGTPLLYEIIFGLKPNDDEPAETFSRGKKTNPFDDDDDDDSENDVIGGRKLY